MNTVIYIISIFIINQKKWIDKIDHTDIVDVPELYIAKIMLIEITNIGDKLMALV